MPTQAEAARQAQEDAMARQAMLQAAAQRAQSDAANRVLRAGDLRSNNEVTIANSRIALERDLENSRATRQEKADEALMNRQLAILNAGKGMSEAEKLANARIEEDRSMDPKRELLRLAMGDKPPVARPPQGAGVSHRGAPSSTTYAPPNPESKTWGANAKVVHLPETGEDVMEDPGYDMTGFNSDVAGIAENVRVARNQSDGQLSYDDLPAFKPGMQGAFVRDPTGVNRQVHFPEASSSQTPNKAAIVKLVRERMMPTPPAGISPSASVTVPATAVSPEPQSDPNAAAWKAAWAGEPPPPMAVTPEKKQVEQPPSASKKPGYQESKEAKLARLAGVDLPLEDRIGQARVMASAVEVDAAQKKLRAGDFTGGAERAALEDVIRSAGGEVPQVVGRGRSADVDTLANDDEFLRAVDETRQDMLSTGTNRSFEGDFTGPIRADSISKSVRAKAQSISDKTGVPARQIINEILSQAKTGVQGTAGGFWSGLGGAIGETFSAGMMETPREAMLKKLEQDFMLDAYRQAQAARRVPSGK